MPDWATQVLDSLVTPHSRGGFVLQLGYFQATGHFFSTDQFWATDGAYVQQRYRLGEVEWARYAKATRFYHRQLILQPLGVVPLRAGRSRRARPGDPFRAPADEPRGCVSFGGRLPAGPPLGAADLCGLGRRRAETFRTVEEHLTTQLALHLTPTVRQQLDALFTTQADEPAHPHRPYRLTTLKRSLELMRPSAIRANVQAYAVLQALFVQVHPVVQALDLSEVLVRYYARYVERAQVSQVQQQADKKYLILGQPSPFLDALQAKLAAAFTRTFERLNAGANPAVRQRADGRPRFLTPARPVAEEALAPRPLVPGAGQISLPEALHTVNQQCRFTVCLAHWNPRYRPPRPADRVFFAGVMAYECNLGLTRMAHATKHVAQATRENTVNWYFSLDNLRRANDAVLVMTGKLPVSRLFRRDPSRTHTSSDGQKYHVTVDSIHATYSYKYFG